MKNKIVVWGTNAENEKVLIALELKAEENKVLMYTFPEALASEEFVNKLMAEWRTGGEVSFPEGYATLERPLSIADSLLPDDIKVERGDLIQRAQTEWHFAVLSAKLHRAYEQELADFKEKVEALSTFDNSVWDSLRSFWGKVQEQARERNLFREHADSLRDNINVLFDDMKQLRAKMQGEFSEASQKVYDEFNEKLEAVEARIATGGAKINTVFEELKKLQRRYRDAKMSNEHRNQLWQRLDAAFKKAKERKFGPGANEGSLIERHQRRLDGLQDAIRRMEGSIKRDEDELNFQQKKVATTEGQLEAQIRTAKIKMIEERIASKREKLADMEKTRADVDRQMQHAAAREAKRAEKEAERKRFEEAKAAAREEIAATIAATPDLTEETAAVEPEEKTKKRDENALDAAGKILSESFEDMVDSVKAVGKVLGEKAGDLLEDAMEKADDLLEDVVEKVEEVAEAVAQKSKAKTRKKAAPEAEPETTAEAETPPDAPKKKKTATKSPSKKAGATAAKDQAAADPAVTAPEEEENKDA